MSRLVAVILAMALLFVALPALADAPTVRTTLSASTIEVGDSTLLTVSVTPGDAVASVELTGLPNGLSIVSQQSMPSFQVTVDPNGQMTQVTSLRKMFRIRASREGTFSLPRPAVVADGKHMSGDRVAIKVVAKGALPPQLQQQNNPFDPFGVFGGRSPFGPLDEPQQQLEPSYPVDPKFNLDHAPDTGTFVHAAVDKARVVVGEQVTLSLYAYVETHSDAEFRDLHEPGTSEFIRHSLLKDESAYQRVAFANVGGKIYQVALLKKYALFPLHTGDLEITPMRVHVTRAGDRASETLMVHVTEPPIDHRPAGYTMGDVGRFTVTAEVAPRDVERGGAIAVNVDLSGWGNLPTSLTVPVWPGVTWLDPEIKDDLHVLDASLAGAPDQWGGTKHFSYIVSPKKEGDIDLGEIVVSFYDPRTHAYDLTRAVLGKIHVKPGVAPVADDVKVLGSMPPVRTAMGGARAPEAFVDDSNVFWGLLGIPTALFGVAAAGRRFARRIAEAAYQRKTSPLAELKLRQRALATAVEADDGRAIDGAAIRVLEAAAAAHAGVNVRGVGGEAVASVLEREGVEPETAAELRDLLEACAAARFSPDGVELETARQRASHVRALVDRLEDGPQSSQRPSSGPG